jgi:hypothetical protein
MSIAPTDKSDLFLDAILHAAAVICAHVRALERIITSKLSCQSLLPGLSQGQTRKKHFAAKFSKFFLPSYEKKIFI